jgi:hypothetical protein
VTILKPPDDVYRIYNGEELALVCRGEGDPRPSVSWKREVNYSNVRGGRRSGSEFIILRITNTENCTFFGQKKAVILPKIWSP